MNVVCMCYNSNKFIKEVIESWRRIGKIHIFIDDKTDDNTEEIVRSLGIIPSFFKFTNFSESRNEILSKFPNGYRIFIDDSYIFIGDHKAFVRELYTCRDTVISVRIIKDNEWFSYSKITKSPAKYEGLVHEYIDTLATYQITNGYIRELTCKEHIERTLRRIPKDYEIMLNDWYGNVTNYRTVYYICRSLLLFLNYGQFVPNRLVNYWLVQLRCMKSPYKKWIVKNYAVFKSQLE